MKNLCMFCDRPVMGFRYHPPCYRKAYEQKRIERERQRLDIEYQAWMNQGGKPKEL